MEMKIRNILSTALITILILTITGIMVSANEGSCSIESDNTNSDFLIESGTGNSGDENACETPDDWNDAGTMGYTNAYSNGEYILDQAQEGINYGFWFEKTVIRWQEFKPTQTSLSQIDLYIKKNGSPGNLSVSITDDTEDQLWETTVSGGDIAKSGWIEIAVDPSISLKPDDSYYIYVWSDFDSPGPDNRYFWRGQTESEYDRGISCVEDNWKGYDFAFRTWGSEGEEEVPDLIVTLEGPEKVIAGEDVALEVIVSNIGSATAPGSIESEIVYYFVDLILSSDNNIPLELAVHPVYAGKTREDFVEDMLLEGGRISRTESISPGSSVSYTLDLYIPEKTSPGIYCLGSVVDPAESIEELNEDNNIYCHKINILPPETPPVLSPENVDFWVMPYAVGRTTLNNINENGLTNYTDWISDYTMVDAPFGSRLGLRHGYDSRIPTDEIMYYRWSYKHESETEWKEFSEPVNVHYVKDDHGVLTFPVYSLGPKGINGMNLYEFRPHNAPDVCEGTGDCETYWPTTDWFADIYSGFLESNAISNGKHDIKLEIYNETGNQVMPDGIKFEFIVPTGIDDEGTILTRETTSGEIDNGGFVFPLHIDNNKCNATIDTPSIGSIGVADECGFLRYSPGDETVHIAFHATHPDNFALFKFRIFRGSKEVTSVKGGEVGAHLVGKYDGDGYGNFENETSIGLLLENCYEAAFSENLYVYAKATTGWGHRINKYDAHAVRAFALSPI